MSNREYTVNVEFTIDAPDGETAVETIVNELEALREQHPISALSAYFALRIYE